MIYVQGQKIVLTVNEMLNIWRLSLAVWVMTTLPASVRNIKKKLYTRIYQYKTLTLNTGLRNIAFIIFVTGKHLPLCTTAKKKNSLIAAEKIQKGCERTITKLL